MKGSDGLTVAAAAAGLLLSAAGLLASTLDAGGVAPPVVWERVRAWSTGRLLWNVPVELPIAALFGLVIVVFVRSDLKSSGLAAWVTAVGAGVGLGAAGWFIATRGGTIPIYAAAAATLVILASAASSRRLATSLDSPSSQPLLRRAKPAAAILAVYVAGCLVLAAGFHVLSARLPSDRAYHRNLQRWYASRERLVGPELAAVLQTPKGVRVVVFTSYPWQPFRPNVPDRLQTVDEYRRRGLVVDFVVMDYPLDTGCNSLTATQITSTAACEAARASKYVSEIQGMPAGRDFADWLYARSTVLSETLIRIRLKDLGVLDDYIRSMDGLRRKVAEDIELAHRLGVRTVPVYFINGVRIPASTVAFQSILDFELARSLTSVATR